MVTGGISLNSGAFSSVTPKWPLMSFVFGFGAFLIIVGILQFCACKGENRCAIFSVHYQYHSQYEIVAVATFLIFGGALVGVWLFKDWILTQIQDASTKDTDFARLFTGVEDNEAHIFKDWCTQAKTVMECSQTEKESIYVNGVPQPLWFSLGSLIEATIKCSGLHKPLESFYFTDHTLYTNSYIFQQGKTNRLMQGQTHRIH